MVLLLPVLLKYCSFATKRPKHLLNHPQAAHLTLPILQALAGRIQPCQYYQAALCLLFYGLMAVV